MKDHTRRQKMLWGGERKTTRTRKRFDGVIKQKEYKVSSGNCVRGGGRVKLLETKKR